MLQSQAAAVPKNPSNPDQTENALQTLVNSQSTIPVPFKNYSALAKYLQTKPSDASLIVSRLLTTHIPNEVNCTNDAIIDFVQLIYCNEELAGAIFDKLYRLIESNKTACSDVLAAVIVACDALQSQTYQKPDNVQLIKLLILLTNGVIKTNIDLTSIPNSLFVVRALAATNAVLNLLIVRGIAEPTGFVTMGDLPYNALSKFFKDQLTNLKEKRDQHPWPYFLCRRAQQSLKAIKRLRTEIQKMQHNSEAAREIIKAFVDTFKGLLTFGGGCTTLGIAIAGTIAGLGAPAPTLIPASIAFGAACFAAGENFVKVAQHIAGAYHHLREQSVTSLNSFQRSMRMGPEINSLNWSDAKVLPEKIFAAIQLEKTKSPIERWNDVDKMAIVYYFTEIMTQTNAPQDFQQKIKDLFAEIYNNNRKDEDSHVLTFILDNIQRLGQIPHYQNVFPALNVANYRQTLVCGSSEADIKKSEQDLKAKINLVEDVATLRPPVIKNISDHRLVQNAWITWFKNDNNLYLLMEYLTALNQKVTTHRLSNAEACKQFIQFYKRFNRSEFFLALEFQNMTSSWGKNYHDALFRFLEQLNLTGDALNDVQIVIQGRAKWRICGKFINGNLIEFISTRSTAEDMVKLIPTEDKRIEYLLTLQKQTLIAQLEHEKEFGSKTLDSHAAQEFRENLLKYVDLEIDRGATLIVGNHELFVALDVVHNELIVEKDRLVPQKTTPFWKLPEVAINANPDLRKNFERLKKEGYTFIITLVSGLSANVKPMITIQFQPPKGSDAEEIIERDTGWLKSKLIQCLNDNGIKQINIQENNANCKLTLQAEAPMLQSIHALLCDLAHRKYDEVQDNAVTEEGKYSCVIS